ncbi:hypothetical protein M378DRAFT_465007 [Amanita muscaria Koide BX008]|uniref:Uncharacterized protein n=1 Tax=Amanita muscaria (strain Koide BX008) TaxID=946122 RepID=A0A0C2S1V3_AMAMK|nr:hypothetical protein M378DRAFT_465007 [Amanita muscaria Koide BX008]
MARVNHVVGVSTSRDQHWRMNELNNNPNTLWQCQLASDHGVVGDPQYFGRTPWLVAQTDIDFFAYMTIRNVRVDFKTVVCVMERLGIDLLTCNTF